MIKTTIWRQVVIAALLAGGSFTVAANAVVGGREVYGAGGTAAAGRDVVGARADSETEHHAEREQHGNGLAKIFSHVSTSKNFRFVALIQGR